MISATLDDQDENGWIFNIVSASESYWIVSPSCGTFWIVFQSRSPTSWKREPRSQWCSNPAPSLQVLDKSHSTQWLHLPSATCSFVAELRIARNTYLTSNVLYSLDPNSWASGLSWNSWLHYGDSLPCWYRPLIPVPLSFRISNSTAPAPFWWLPMSLHSVILWKFQIIATRSHSLGGAGGMSWLSFWKYRLS